MRSCASLRAFRGLPLGLLLLLALPAQAQIAVWDPSGAVTSSGDLAFGFAEDNVFPGNLSKAPVLSSNLALDRYQAGGFPTGPLDPLRYFEFSVEPEVGFEIAYASIGFTLGGTGVGGAGWELRSDVDGYTATLDSGSGLDVSGSGATFVADVSTLGSVAAQVRFRLYVFENTGTSPGVRSIVGSPAGGVGIEVFGTLLWNGEWEQRNSDGFGDDDDNGVFGLIQFGNHLYAGTEEGRIWRSLDGSAWTPVADLGDRVYMGALFGGALYVGTEATGGGTLYRSFDGTTWTPVSTPGLGDPDNEVLWPRTVFNGELYVGTRKELPNGPGGEVWRSPDGTTWTQVNADGFGDLDVAATNVGVVFDGQLYVGAFNLNTGGELWRSPDGLHWSEVFPSAGLGIQEYWPSAVLDGQIYATTSNGLGTQVYRSSDGTSWSSVTLPGFGNTDNRVSFLATVFGSELYAITHNFVTGGEVWTSGDGSSWTQSSGGGFGETSNRLLFSVAGFGTGVYVGSWKLSAGGTPISGGGEVWAALPEPAVPLSVALGTLLIRGLARCRRRRVAGRP